MRKLTCLVHAAGGALALCVVSSGVARADAKYTRKTMEIKVKQTEATAKLEARKADPNEKKGPAPEITADRYFQIEGAVQDIQDEVIAELEELIRETADDDPEKADLLFRLAEAFADKERFYHIQGMDAQIKSEDPRTKRGERGKYASQAKSYFEKEKKWLVKAVKIYKALAENPRFKNYPRMDEALFYYAYTLTQAKYEDEARTVYLRLIKDYPNSRYIPDAYLSFAEFYFKNNKLTEAEKFYDKVLQFPKSSVYIYALYMKGWVYYNQARPQDSLETWFKVAQATQNNKKQATLNRASKKDFVRAYADVGKAELAHKAFQRVDPDYAFKMLGFLGEYYLSQGKAEKTIFVFREMLDKAPKDPQVCEWQYTVVRAMLTIGTQEQKVKEVQNLDKLYKFLKEGKGVPASNLAECRDNAQATTGELAKVWHQEGLKTLNYETLGHVSKLYHLYMEYFPDAEDAPEMQFYYAELLWKRAEGEKNQSKAAILWEDAAAEYTKVLDMGGKIEAKTQKESAYASVLAWKNALAVDPSSDRPPVDADPKKDDKEPVVPKLEPIPEKEQKMIAAFDVYIKYVTDNKDDELTQIKFFKGRIYWKYHNYDKAIPLLEEVIKTRPDHEVAEFAVNILLDALARAGKTEDLLKWVDRVLAMEKFLEGKDDLRQNLELLKRQSERMLAEKLEKDGKYQQCGVAYRDIFNKYPNGEDLAEILHNASVCFDKARLIGQAIQMREELTKRFEKNPLAQKAQFALGLNYAAIAGPFYEKAAEKFEQYARKFGGEKNAADALGNAVLFRRGLGQDEKAMDDASYFIKQYGKQKPQDAAAAFFSMYEIYEKKRDWDGEVKHLSEYLKRFAKQGGIDRQIMAHAKIGQIRWRMSCPVKGINDACVEVKRERAIKTGRGKGKRKRQSRAQCGAATHNKIIVHDRKAAPRKEAQGHFATALKLFADGKAIGDVGGKDDGEKAARTAQMIYWYAAANYYLGEEKYENFLGLKFPENLDFAEANKKRFAESKKKFAKWNADKQAALDAAQKVYLGVKEIKGGGAHWAVASAARVGQLFQNYNDALSTAPIPTTPKDVLAAGLTDDDFADLYCDALTEVADPLEQRSVDAFSFCLNVSTDLNWFNEWSKLCEGELAQIRPQDFPTAGEVRANPDDVPMTLDIQPIVTELDSGAEAKR